MRMLPIERAIAAMIAIAVLGGVVFPAAAGGSGPPLSEEPDPPPGITITGLGFARPAADQRSGEAADPVAVARAVRDARRRAAAIVAAVNVELGGVDQVELRELTQFSGRGLCRGRAGPGRCEAPALTVAAATVTFALAGGAEGIPAVRAHGVASVLVDPGDSQRNQPIRRALLAARRAATPEAAALARRNARSAARAAGWSLGPVVSIAESTPYYYGSSFYDQALGSFGPGRYCGLVNHPVVRPDPETGVSRVVRRVRKRRCIVQRTYSVELEIAYAAR